MQPWWCTQRFRKRMAEIESLRQAMADEGGPRKDRPRAVSAI